MLFSIVKNPIIHTVYQYDTNLFISLFCENKERPQLNCDGKCYLAKMQKEENKEEAASMLKQLASEILFYDRATPVDVVCGITQMASENKPASFYNRLYTFLYSKYEVKPPEFSVVFSA